MKQLIASVDYRPKEIHKEWEDLFGIIVRELSKAYKISIFYEAYINEDTAQVELYFLDLPKQDWYQNTELREIILDKLITHFKMFVLEN